MVIKLTEDMHLSAAQKVYSCQRACVGDTDNAKLRVLYFFLFWGGKQQNNSKKDDTEWTLGQIGNSTKEEVTAQSALALLQGFFTQANAEVSLAQKIRNRVKITSPGPVKATNTQNDMKYTTQKASWPLLCPGGLKSALISVIMIHRGPANSQLCAMPERSSSYRHENELETTSP